MAKGSRKGFSGGGSNNNVNGATGMSKAMKGNMSPPRPKPVVKAPSMKETLGPGSRKGNCC